MNTRFDACALKRWLRLGSAGGMTLLALSACATGSAGQRSGAPMPPHAEPPAPRVTATPPAPTAAVAPAAQEQSPVSAPPQTEEPAPSDVPPSPAPAPAPTPAPSPAPAAPAPGAPPSVAPANAAGDEKMLPPCVPVRRTRVKHHKPKASPPVPADAVVDAQVGEVGTSLSSILGQEVMSPKGEKLGRIVDVLADAQGHVRVAIIDFGGFLGVGTRRIAVDWPLLRFDPDSNDKPLILSVDRQKLQSAPEYHSNKPRVLMPPAAPDAADAGQTKK